MSDHNNRNKRLTSARILAPTRHPNRNFSLSAEWLPFEIDPPWFQIEPEDWRKKVNIFTSGLGTDWVFGGLIAFLTGTEPNGTALREPSGSRAFNLVHNLTSGDPNYHWISGVQNEFNYTQPPDERVGIIEPQPPLLEEGHQMNKCAAAEHPAVAVAC